MRMIDISLPLSAETAVYEGDPHFELERLVDEPYRLSRIGMSTHCGTHVDAPSHFGGSGGVETLDLGALCGPATVVDLQSGPRAIDRAALERLALRSVKRLLLKTHRGEMHQAPPRVDHAFLTADGASFLRKECGARLIGTDCLSIDASDDSGGAGFPAHRVLLIGEGPVVVVEGLDLSAVTAGDYELWCLPLRILRADGAPARAILVQR
ncbi:MAG: cyclase family protein [Deltaproteobacteria bacterium]|nr:cyclase family protein [Deltaproteobacteria bacterium]